MPRICSESISAPLVYRFILGRLINKIGAKILLNLGDLIVHTAAKQLYIFDWPYALDVHQKIWSDMNLMDLLKRKVKLFFLKKHFHRPDIVVAQTDEIKKMLEQKYKIADIRVIKNAVTFDANIEDGKPFYQLPAGTRLVYPAVYYPHKNIEILLDLATIIKNEKLSYLIVTTVKPDTWAAKRFLNNVRKRRLDDVIINIGQVPLNRMHSLYKLCDALLMPTLLETFGIVYLEAMYHGLPIFTSDMWFAHAVCGDAAKYFNPFDANDILCCIDEVFSCDSDMHTLVNAGAQRFTFFPTWSDNFIRYQKYILELLEKD